ncbi:hypothetical protein G6045_08655 [Streptomyces sp. YC504]|uniref:Uncharacterized protein n=1 Tax=Streptomyces mesophilus TaxID=1775132 RepID=A0A6G4XET1_9ACTN|nr:hypothetical protein [Streptomyces mesophilus]NGO75743.1 hypothetical protein [Streptomyces mesophilus]
MVVWWEQSGPFWRRRWENVQELPWWGLLRTATAHVALPFEFADGIIPHDALTDELQEWDENCFPLRGANLRLQWECRAEQALLLPPHP